MGKGEIQARWKKSSVWSHERKTSCLRFGMLPPSLKTEAVYRFGDHMKSRRRSFLSPSFLGPRAVCVFLPSPPLPLWRKQTRKLLFFAQNRGARPQGPAGFTSTINTRRTDSESGRRKHHVASWLKCLGKELESPSPGPQPGEVPPPTDVGFPQGHRPGSDPCQPLPDLTSSGPL